ncbi:hypothetical protein KEC58_20855 (plasmid) [Photobacterium damselae]|uniref:hypothetical protein n=1 Tax=Photobacterium damselae TaxID=38293 RepID=UPI00254273E9
MCKLVSLVAVAVALSGSQYTNASHTFTSEFDTISIEQIKPYVQNNGKVIRERSRGMNMMVGKWDLQYSSIHYNAPDSLLISKANSNNLNCSGQQILATVLEVNQCKNNQTLYL